MESDRRIEVNRRWFVGYLSSMGLGSTLLPGTLTAVAQEAPRITAEMVESASRLAGISLERPAIDRIVGDFNSRMSLLPRYDAIRAMNLGNSVPPALVFSPVLAGVKLPTVKRPLRVSSVKVLRPSSEDDLAFLPVTHLAKLLRTRQVTSTELTRVSLKRLRTYDPRLKCVVTLTEELALQQAKQADEEIRAGRYRGPLHGIPWGAKDLLAVKGYKTTFGASPYKDQVIDADATVYSRLTAAGAVLVAKLTLGALAQGDRWFGGMTKSPWDPDNANVGSSGSSAGPASAVAAGLVPFAIGSETRGSIMSPATRCGVTGLRPTFGRVSRHGAMALSWSMDKIGPICRTAEDCALVLDAIHGPDGKDNTVLDVPFNWDSSADVRKLRVGYLKSAFDAEIADDPKNPQRVERMRDGRKMDLAALETIRALGVELKPIELPKLDADALGFILTVESAAAFDDLTRSGKLDQMSAPPERSSWVETFRVSRFVPAVEYIQANRARYRMMEEFDKVFGDLDLFVGSSLALTNLTGHPEISLPHGFDSKGQPGSLRFTGRLFGEEQMLLLAHAFQKRTDFHRRRPKL